MEKEREIYEEKLIKARNVVHPELMQVEDLKSMILRYQEKNKTLQSQNNQIHQKYQNLETKYACLTLLKAYYLRKSVLLEQEIAESKAPKVVELTIPEADAAEVTSTVEEHFKERAVAQQRQ